MPGKCLIPSSDPIKSVRTLGHGCDSSRWEDEKSELARSYFHKRWHCLHPGWIQDDMEASMWSAPGNAPLFNFLSDNKAKVTDWSLFLWFGHLDKHSMFRLIYPTFSTLAFLAFFSHFLEKPFLEKLQIRSQRKFSSICPAPHGAPSDWRLSFPSLPRYFFWPRVRRSQCLPGFHGKKAASLLGQSRLSEQTALYFRGHLFYFALLVVVLF